MKTLLLATLLMFSSMSMAQESLFAVQQSCAAGTPITGVNVKRIPNSEINVEENFRRDMTATYRMFEGREIGYARNAAGTYFILYRQSVYPVDKPVLIGMSSGEYKDGLRNGDFEFNQIADWSLLSHRNKRFLCIALSQPMEKAKNYLYLLDLTSKPGALYFSAVAIKR